MLSDRCPWYCVCRSGVRVVARGLTALAFASTPSPRERPRCIARRTLRTHTPPTSVRRRTRIPSHCSLLACLGTEVASAGGVVPTRVVQPNARGGPHHPLGLYSTEAVTLKSTQASRPRCTSFPLRSNDSDESIIPTLWMGKNMFHHLGWTMREWHRSRSLLSPVHCETGQTLRVRTA